MYLNRSIHVNKSMLKILEQPDTNHRNNKITKYKNKHALCIRYTKCEFVKLTICTLLSRFLD